MMGEKELRGRLKAKSNYIRFIMTYIFVNVLCFLINWFTNPDDLWVKWVFFGMTIALLANTFNYFRLSFFGKDWEDKKVEEWKQQHHQEK